MSFLDKFYRSLAMGMSAGRALVNSLPTSGIDYGVARALDRASFPRVIFYKN